MTAALRRLPVLTLALCAAWLAARGVGALLLPELMDGIDLAAGGVEGSSPVVTAPPALPGLEELAASNLFLLPPPAAPDPSPQPAVLTTLPAEPSVVGPCSLPYRAVALVAFDGEAGEAQGFAAVEHGGGVTEFRVGDHLDDALVTRIGWNRLFLRRAGGATECWLDLRVPPPPPPPAPPSRRPTAEAPPAVESPEGAPTAPRSREERFALALAEGIAPLGEDEFSVDRSILTTAVENPDLATGAARVTPARDGGATVGFRLFGVRPDGLAGQLGLRTGDVVTSINGVPLDGVDNLMRVWGLVRQAETIEAVVFRRGEARTLRYRIR